MSRFCEECEILFDCEFNKDKHDEIIHLSDYNRLPLSSGSPLARAIGLGTISALLGSKGLF